MTELDDLLTAAGSVGTASVATLTRGRGVLDDAIRATGSPVRSDEMDEILADARDDFIPLQAIRAKARRGPAIWLTAAAVAAAFALTGTVVWDGEDSGSHAGGMTPLTADRLRIPFTLDPSAGVQLIGYRTSSGVASAILADDQHLLQLDITADRFTVVPSTAVVDINGRPGVVETNMQTVGTASASASAGQPPTTASASATPANSSFPTTSITWPDQTGHKLLLQGLGTPVGKAYALRVARALDFGGGGHTLRSAISVGSVPDGAHLAFVDFGYHQVGPEPPIRITSAAWSSTAEYYLDNGRGFTITVEGADGTGTSKWAVGADTPDAQQVTVGGHGGYWSPSQQSIALTLDKSSNTYLVVAFHGTTDAGQPAFGVPEPSDRSGGSGTYEQLQRIVESVTVAGKPLDSTTWFDAADALPLD